MEIRTKFAIGQEVVTNNAELGEVEGIEYSYSKIMYAVDTDEGTDEYFESELTAVIEQDDNVIRTKYDLAQLVYVVQGDKIFKGTIKKIYLTHKQDDPEIEYEIGDYSPHVVLETDGDIYSIGEESKIIECITINID